MDAKSSLANVTRPRRALLPLAQYEGKVPTGSLILSDVFTSEGVSHGVEVAKAAWSLGFQGPIFYQQAVDQPLPPLQAHLSAAQTLATPNLDSDTLHTALHDYITGPPLHMLMSGAEEVERAGRSGANATVLNLSSGMCKAQATSLLYDEAAVAWKAHDPESKTRGRAVLENLSALFGTDAEKVLAGDPDSRARFQQSVVGLVDSVWNKDSQIESQRGRFSDAVKAFESGHNSVVIAAGNEGLVKPRLEMETGLELRVPADFEENVLAAPEVTSVGATIILDGVEAPARYSSTWAGVRFYAPGDAALGQEFDDNKGLGEAGSSLAAPRIGALMARVHGAHPEWASGQVEAVVAGQFITGPQSMLDTDSAFGFLRETAPEK